MTETDKEVLQRNKIPEKIYRYMPWNSYAVATLTNHSLHMSSPIRFNDEFEVIVPIIEIFPDAQDLLNEYNDETSRILCFSDSYQKAAMWYNYAGHGEGICLEFTNLWEPSDLSPIIYDYTAEGKTYKNAMYFNKQNASCSHLMGRVAYLEHMPDIGLKHKFKFNEKELARTAIISYMPFFFKSKEWENESEIRLVRFDESIGDLYVFDKPKLTAVYLGTKMSEVNKDVVKDIISSKFPKTEVHALRRIRGDYGYEKEIKGVVDEKDFKVEVT